MKQFYLRYEQEDKRADNPFEVRITISLNPIHDAASISSNKFDFQKRIYVEAKYARTVLNTLIGQIKEKTELRYDFIDALNDNPKDDLKKFAGFRRHITFLPQGTWKKVDQTEEEAKSEAQDYNKSLHSKLFPVYQQFVKEHSPYSEKRR